jgi:polar amino acid transport system substrate-binding protein
MEDPNRHSSNAANGSIMRIRGLIAIGIIAIALIANSNAKAEATASYDVPLFRQVEQLKKPPSIDGLGTIKLLTDEDFPPFSFRKVDGSMTGLDVELAQSLCAEVGVTCEVVPMPWSGLLKALESGQGSAIISGLRMNEKAAEELDTTRPFFRALGRFATRPDTQITEITPGLLAGKKIGVVAGTGHAAWMTQYFKTAEITPFGSGVEARAALKDKKVDLVFGDALELIYWIKGEDSSGCCSLVPGAYVDPDYFSNPLFYVVRRGDTPLRRVLDYGLDRMQATGRFADIFRRYVPLNPW